MTSSFLSFGKLYLGCCGVGEWCYIPKNYFVQARKHTPVLSSCIKLSQLILN